MPRLFVAVWPPDDVLDLIAALPRPDVEGLRWTGREQWHVTLRFFGSVELSEAAGALGRVSAPATTAVLGPSTGRFGKGVLHVPVAGLEAVAAAVVGATTKVGKPPELRPFTGHLTLARARDRRRGIDLRPLVGTVVAATWSVTEVCLVESHLSPKGANYDVVETVPLQQPRTMG
ncbi:MAG: RNA 2',3'-cyclic phosphodiesterase [Acidimicrobiia bacterium]|nr:RNA 2',3'-cyclic phosphodiesterase [Acidimicrobiia bacterium]